MHLVGNNSSMQPIQLWSVDKSTFLHLMMCIYKHWLFSAHAISVLVFALKCCTKIPCPLPHNHYCCLLSSPICWPHLLICTCLISSPIACPPSSSVLCWCLLRFFIFAICYISLWLHFGLFVYIFLSDWFLCLSIILSMLFYYFFAYLHFLMCLLDLLLLMLVLISIDAIIRSNYWMVTQ